jgi:hypothetical protein
MTVKELEQRVVVLDAKCRRLNSQLQATKAKGGKGWLAAVEEFAGDEDLSAYSRTPRARTRS